MPPLNELERALSKTETKSVLGDLVERCRRLPKQGWRPAVQELTELAQQNEFSLEIRRIYPTGEYRITRPKLTNSQQESLVRAFEVGYFKVPKEGTLTELADAQGVSHQAMSERIRRGVHHLIKRTLITGDSPDQDDE